VQFHVSDSSEMSNIHQASKATQAAPGLQRQKNTGSGQFPIKRQPGASAELVPRTK